jgi:fatty acid desaturase
MTLPKGYGPSGKRAEGAGPRDEIERMIGRRVEHMNGIYVLGFILCLVGTWGGIYVGVTVYPWAYPLPSGMFAGSVLTVIISLGFIFIVKIANEKSMRP